MAAWLLWLIAGLILISAEVLSGDLWLLMIGLGAFGGAAAAGVTDDLVVSTIVFAVASIALVGGLRPLLKRRLLATTGHKTNTQALIGAKATVVAPVDEHQGRVKIGGEIWSARAHSPDDRLAETGTPVIVMEISGATAIVAPEP
ncbi:membrane protein implicated in regulation of membrane protease activity [Kibdelosporangium banguiense]|uniref:Membrane protein implicated in regulation of membrane protease activity n=1 Tax=Kibdelosporangium banguiense TaxID=1365924 RepID=A0ABS4TSU7_9PSEU|nr:NfeD family protein [Kibdelosporangium banguiense]MBP2327482.1 membrane protein implicated in regulation of membrane protease activity [Kibdelosporangium banguiense]